MGWVRVSWLVALAGCGAVDLARLEAKQEELQGQFDNLQRTVRDMRKEMVDLGMISSQLDGDDPFKAAKAGKGKAPAGNLRDHQRPELDLASSLPFTATRTGDPVPLPALPEMEKDEPICGYKFSLPTLKAISDFVLHKHSDVGRASPIELLVDGAAWTGHATGPQLEACEGKFRHSGQLVQFSPAGDASKANGPRYEIRLSPEVPLARGGDGRPMYWVYPGTTLTFDVDPWQAGWGAAGLDLAMHLGGEGVGAITVTVGDDTHSLAATSDGTLSLDPTPNAEGLTVSIASPADGPYVVLQSLTLGNERAALVVTGEAAWKGANP